MLTSSARLLVRSSIGCRLVGSWDFSPAEMVARRAEVVVRSARPGVTWQPTSASRFGDVCVAAPSMTSSGRLVPDFTASLGRFVTLGEAMRGSVVWLALCSPRSSLMTLSTAVLLSACCLRVTKGVEVSLPGLAPTGDSDWKSTLEMLEIASLVLSFSGRNTDWSNTTDFWEVFRPAW